MLLNPTWSRGGSTRATPSLHLPRRETGLHTKEGAVTRAWGGELKQTWKWVKEQIVE